MKLSTAFVILIVIILTFVTKTISGSTGNTELRTPRIMRGALILMPPVITEDLLKREVDPRDSGSKNAKNAEDGRDKRKVTEAAAATPTTVTKITTSCSETTTSIPELCPRGRKFEMECNNCLCDPTNGDAVCTTYICSKTVYHTTTRTPPQPPPPTRPPKKSFFAKIKELL